MGKKAQNTSQCGRLFKEVYVLLLTLNKSLRESTFRRAKSRLQHLLCSFVILALDIDRMPFCSMNTPKASSNQLCTPRPSFSNCPPEGALHKASAETDPAEATNHSIPLFHLQFKTESLFFFFFPPYGTINTARPMDAPPRF